MTLDEAIKHAEEVAIEQDKLCKRYDGASGYSRSHNEAIRTTEAKRCEECAKEHRQLAEWLKDYKRLLGAIDAIKEEIEEVGYAKDEYGDIRADVLSVKKVLNIIEKHISGGDEE